MDWSIPMEGNPCHNRHGIMQEQKRAAIRSLAPLIKNKRVLDLACHDGTSSMILYDSGAASVVGVDIRDDLIKFANQSRQGKNIFYFCNDIENLDLLSALVKESDIVVCLGAFYHLRNNFDWLDTVCAENVERVILETMFGVESPQAHIFPLFENTSLRANGYHPKYKKVPVNQVNFSWIYQAMMQFDWRLEYLEKGYHSRDFAHIIDFETNKRMFLKMYNPRKISKTDYLEFDQIWQWDDNNLIHQC